mgnify:CR=1 FL=1
MSNSSLNDNNSYVDSNTNSNKQNTKDLNIPVASGMNGLLEVATIPESEILVTAIVGMLGIRPTIAAIEAGKDIEFTDVLMVGGKVGTPTVEGAKVVCTAEKNGKAKKIVVFKFHAKKKYRKTQGHRQPYTKLVVKTIVG